MNRLFEYCPLPTAQQMRQWDAGAAEAGLPTLLLMENAAHAALEVLQQCTGAVRGKTVWLTMGSGNNGGDAAALARLLDDAGAYPLLLHSKPLHAYTGAAGKHLKMARAAGIACCPVARHSWNSRPPHILIDGLLGTGLQGAMRPASAAVVAQCNALREHSFILALDIPSGMESLNGLPCPDAVRAHATVTFEAAKPALMLPHAATFTGQVYTRPVGIPRRVRAALPPDYYGIVPACAALLPTPAAQSHKNSFGHVLVLGGAEGMRGAAHLTARAALRSGCGLVSIAAPHGEQGSACAELRLDIPDIMTLPLHSIWWPEQLPSAWQQALLASNAVVLGPGMGRSPQAAALCAAVLALPQRPRAVVDADALFALAHAAPLLAPRLRADDCITPHPGEAARLLGISNTAVQADRFAAHQALQRRYGCLCVLKGAGTLVGSAGQPCGIAPYAVPNLALAGSGDILAGCIASLMAQGMETTLATALAVLLHATAGTMLAKAYPQRGNLSRDTADALPAARAFLHSGSLSQNMADTLPPASTFLQN